MRLPVLAAALLLTSFSGCLGTAQDLFRLDAGDDDDPFAVESVTFTYELVPARAGAYQFLVPPGVDRLEFELVHDEDDEDESKEGAWGHGRGDRGDEEDGADGIPFLLFTAQGDRTDPVADGEGHAFLANPTRDSYVLVARHDPPAPLEIRFEAAPGPVLAGSVVSTTVLPLEPVHTRDLLAQRGATDEGDLRGTLAYGFPPLALWFTTVGSGTEFRGTVASRDGLLYEHEEMPLLALPGRNSGPTPPPCCFTPGFRDLDERNLDGATFTWTVATDLRGSVHLEALVPQPAASDLFAPGATAEPRDEEAWHLHSGWDDDWTTPFAAAPGSSADDWDADGEHFFAGHAEPGRKAYAFTVPADARALLFEADHAGCDWTTSYDEEQRCHAGAVTKASLLRPDGTRLGLLALHEGHRLVLPTLSGGEFILYVHDGPHHVRVGVVGLPPADGSLHARELVELHQQRLSLTRTPNAAAATATFALDALPLRMELRLRCPAQEGFDLYARATGPAGIAFVASRDAYGPTFGPLGMGCFSANPLGLALPETLAAGDHRIVVESTGGVGDVQFLVFGLPAVVEQTHGAPEHAPALPAPPGPWESLIG